LKARFVRDARVQVHARDGYEAALALTPFAEKRGLVFIDPPFERADDFDRSLDCIQGVLSRFRQAMILWWRPLKDARALARVDATAASFGVESTRLDFAIGTAAPTGPLRASSLLLFNPPFGAAAEGECVRDWLTPRLALSP
jgi:23S rRNA (adenine2030-N6)-methyltransferase